VASAFAGRQPSFTELNTMSKMYVFLSVASSTEMTSNDIFKA